MHCGDLCEAFLIMPPGLLRLNLTLLSKYPLSLDLVGNPTESCRSHEDAMSALLRAALGFFFLAALTNISLQAQSLELRNEHTEARASRRRVGAAGRRSRLLPAHRICSRRYRPRPLLVARARARPAAFNTRRRESRSTARASRRRPRCLPASPLRALFPRFEKFPRAAHSRRGAASAPRTCR